MTLFPNGAYTARIVFKDEWDTKTRTSGASIFGLVDTASQAASLGRDPEPPSPKWSTKPASGFCKVPIEGHLGTNMFSSKTDTVCDFPEPVGVYIYVWMKDIKAV